MNFFVENMNLVIFLPLIVCLIFVFNSQITMKLDKSTLFLISLVSAFVTCVISFFAIKNVFFDGLFVDKTFDWLITDYFDLSLGYFVDNVSTIFIFILCLLNLAFQLFLYKFLNNDVLFNRFLLSTNFLVFSLSGLFLSPNLFQTYLFCELVGVSLYLSTNFDISNRSQTKTGTRFFIYNRVSDCFLLFCILTIFYCMIVVRNSNIELLLGYGSVNELVSGIKSILPLLLFVVFCALLFGVSLVKVLQSVIYFVFSFMEKNLFSRFAYIQNTMIFLVGIYLYFRLSPFFGELNNMWCWVFGAIFVLFLILYSLQKTFFIFSKTVGLFEKYVLEMVEPFVEFFVRTMSYICENCQKGNFQVRLIHSLIGLILILGFVILYYIVCIKW